MRVRDSQRSKVYSAEHEFRKTFGLGQPLPTVEDVRRFTHRVFTAKRVLKRWPFMAAHAVVVKDGRGRRNACAWEDDAIAIPLWARNELVVLHELAHIIHSRGGRGISAVPRPLREHGLQQPALGLDPLWHQAHGYGFCRIFLDLVKLYMGSAAEKALKAAYKKHRVRYKAKRVLSPEQRLALANRLRRMRGDPIQIAA